MSPGDFVICVNATGHTDLRKGRAYHVAPSERPSRLIALEGLPGRLFHPARFMVVK
jgi:hypothetical protein